ncbi:hypothetical protein SAMN04488084_1089 [Pedobacter antarcticus]|nr:hypothetical protein SAMN04488084_1089 [Pedobacter antarcticus]
MKALLFLLKSKSHLGCTPGKRGEYLVQKKMKTYRRRHQLRAKQAGASQDCYSFYLFFALGFNLCPVVS